MTGRGEKLIKSGRKVVSHGRYAALQMAEIAVRLIAELRPPPDAAPAYNIRLSCVTPNSRERCASMTENSAIFNARHGAGSFHPHRQPTPTAQDCLKRGNGAIEKRLCKTRETIGRALAWPIIALTCTPRYESARL